MAVKKTSVKDLEAKAAAPKKAAEKAPAKAPVKKAAEKTEAKKEEVKEAVKEAETKAAAKVTTAKETAKEAVKTVAKKAPAKKAPAKTKEELFIQYQGGNVAMSDIIAKAVEASGKKSVKELNVYYQPENAKVYYTADDEKGEFSL